jgi:hypothetical protein
MLKSVGREKQEKERKKIVEKQQMDDSSQNHFI